MVDDPVTTMQKHKQNVIHSERRIAGGAVLYGQFVKIGATDNHVVAATLNSQNLGVALNAVTAAQVTAFASNSDLIATVEVEVAVVGVVPVLAGGALTGGGFVKSDANGRAIAVAGDGTDEICGKVLVDASTDGKETHVLLLFQDATD